MADNKEEPLLVTKTFNHYVIMNMPFFARKFSNDRLPFTVNIRSTSRHILYKSMKITGIDFSKFCRSLKNIIVKLQDSAKSLV